MTKLLFIPALLLVACTDVAAPDDQVPSSSTASDDGDGSASVPETPDAPVASLSVGFTQEPASCDDNSVRLRGYVFTSDGISIENPVCVFTLPDGRTYEGCFIVPSMPIGEIVTFTATDPATGATGTYEELVSGPPSFDATLDLVAHDHAFSWAVTTHFGAGVNSGDVRLDIDPIQTVVIPDPSTLRNFTGTVSVTALGTYTVTAHASIAYGELTCNKDVSETVTVFCDGSAHQ